MEPTGLEIFFRTYPDKVDELIEETAKHGDPQYAARLIGIQQTWAAELLAYSGGAPDKSAARVNLEAAMESGLDARPAFAKRMFVLALHKHASIPEAVRSQPWYKRSWFRGEKESDPVFGAAWDEAHETAVDDLRIEAWRRAAEGVEEPVIYQGKLQYEIDEVTGERTPLVVRKYSDNMLAMLLKRYDKTFNERVSIDQVTEVKGSGVSVDLTPEALSRLTDDELAVLRKFVDLQGPPVKDDDGADSSD